MCVSGRVCIYMYVCVCEMERVCVVYVCVRGCVCPHPTLKIKSSSTYSYPKHQINMSDQFHTPAPLPHRITPKPDKHSISVWVGSREDLNIFEKKKFGSTVI